MLLENDLQGLITDGYHDPFQFLGARQQEEGIVWRVLLPHAVNVNIQGTKHRTFAMEQLGCSPFFEWRGKAKKLARHPELIWSDAAGVEHVCIDPYSFKPQLSDDEVLEFRAGSSFSAYRLLGAIGRCYDDVDGVEFVVWAPNASCVSVVGDFNRWHESAHLMTNYGESGLWALFIPDFVNGDLYKFSIRTMGQIALKADPYARRAEFRPRTASVVSLASDYDWGDQQWLANRSQLDWLHAPMTIYEVHLGSWRRLHNDAPGYRCLAQELVTYVRQLGFTHIEILPVAEHPLDDSWGYQTTGYYAPTSRYGSPDDLRYLVDQCHQQGIGIILDWTAAHFPKDAHGLALFDGTYLYEHADASQREHPDWNTLVFNYGRNEVRSFLLSNAAYWIEEFHFDGLRVDAVASMLYLDYSRDQGEWTPNQFGGNENLAAMDFLKQLNIGLHKNWPGVMVIAEESTAWPMVSRPVYLGGLGFSMKWNMGWMHDSLQYMSQDPVHRKYHHDAMTFSMMYAFSENFVLPFSHDEVVHGKGSMLHKMPGDEWQQFANLRLLYGYQYCMPGKKLLFMGNEFGTVEEWQFRKPLDWDQLEQASHAGVLQLIRDLNEAIRRYPALHELDFSDTGFHWLDCHDNNQSVLAFIRIPIVRSNTELEHNDDERVPEDRLPIICLFNFTPIPRFNYRVGVPRSGRYEEIFNSDSSYYGGSNLGNYGGMTAQSIPWMNQIQSVSLTLPPLAAVILKPGDVVEPELSN